MRHPDITYEKTWVHRKWDDGTEQFATMEVLESAGKKFYAVERIVGDKSKRKQWRVVNRGDDSNLSEHSKYPPAIGEPFKELTDAMAACEVITKMEVTP